MLVLLVKPETSPSLLLLIETFALKPIELYFLISQIRTQKT